MAKCEICKKREAVLTYSDEPMFAITHGWGKIEICRQCYIEKMQKMIEDCRKGIKEQKALIRKDKFRSEKNE